jgi:hypothetical protein
VVVTVVVAVAAVVIVVDINMKVAKVVVVAAAAAVVIGVKAGEDVLLQRPPSPRRHFNTWNPQSNSFVCTIKKITHIPFSLARFEL